MRDQSKRIRECGHIGHILKNVKDSAWLVTNSNDSEKMSNESGSEPENTDARVKKKDSTSKPLPSAMAFVGMGTTIAGCVALGVVIGILGDDRFHTGPILLLVGLVLGILAAVGSVISQIRRYL